MANPATPQPPHSYASSATAEEMPARPKVLRRPAQFSHAPVTSPRVATALPDEPIDTSEPPAIPAVRHLPWQEDSRFGLALIALLLMVNVVLMLGVPLMAQPPGNTEPTAVTIVSSTSMPQAVITQRPRITLYSDPDMLDESARRMDLNELSPEHADDFSAIAEEIPPPEAHPLTE